MPWYPWTMRCIMPPYRLSRGESGRAVWLQITFRVAQAFERLHFSAGELSWISRSPGLKFDRDTRTAKSSSSCPSPGGPFVPIWGGNLLSVPVAWRARACRLRAPRFGGATRSGSWRIAAWYMRAVERCERQDR